MYKTSPYQRKRPNREEQSQDNCLLKMKTRLLMIFATITISLLGYTQYADALCMENQDWIDAPCYGCIGCYPGLEQEKLDWEPYYDYKGST